MHILSRYQFCESRTYIDGMTVLSGREPFAYRDESDNRYHTASAGDRLWSLAHTYFGSFERACGLWWIIGEFQPTPILDPTIALAPGTKIVIPSERLVHLEVFGAGQRRLH